MKLLQNLKENAGKIKEQILLVYYVYRHPKTGLLPKIIIAIALGYALSPVDLIPDFIPVIGYLDDLIIIPILINLSLKLVPSEILTECRLKALNHPVGLKDNWKAGVIIILIWVLVIFIIIRFFLNWREKITALNIML